MQLKINLHDKKNSIFFEHLDLYKLYFMSNKKDLANQNILFHPV